MTAIGAPPGGRREAIRGRRELAIHGAPPAFSAPLHVGRPNTGDRAKFATLMDGVFERNWLTNDGPLVRQFEARISEYIGARNVVATCNGTVALQLALSALGVTGEVIVPSFTFIATVHAIHTLGLTPVFVDIDPTTHCIDPALIRSLVTPRTSAIVAVHLWGRPAPVAELQEVCDEFGLKLVLDAAHAFAVSACGRLVGNSGNCEVFSFHATKFLNSFEGGAIATNDDTLAAGLRLARNFGFAGFDNVVSSGINGKMTEACAAMGLVNFDSIDDIIACNRLNMDAYRIGLDGIPGITLRGFDDSERQNWQYVVVELDEREFGRSRNEVVAALHAENVLARKYFWPGCHRMMPYRDLCPRAGATLPMTERVAERVIVLPTGTSTSAGDIATISSILEALHSTVGNVGRTRSGR